MYVINVYRATDTNRMVPVMRYELDCSKSDAIARLAEIRAQIKTSPFARHDIAGLTDRRGYNVR